MNYMKCYKIKGYKTVAINQSIARIGECQE